MLSREARLSIVHVQWIRRKIWTMYTGSSRSIRNSGRMTLEDGYVRSFGRMCREKDAFSFFRGYIRQTDFSLPGWCGGSQEKYRNDRGREKNEERYPFDESGGPEKRD